MVTPNNRFERSRVCVFGWAKEGVDDWDKAASLVGDAPPRRSISSLDAAAMATPDREDTIVRVGCGAVVGLFVGLALLVGTVSYFANSTLGLVSAVAVSVLVCAVLAWRFGDRFFQALHKWIRWL